MGFLRFHTVEIGVLLTAWHGRDWGFFVRVDTVEICVFFFGFCRGRLVCFFYGLTR